MRHIAVLTLCSVLAVSSVPAAGQPMPPPMPMAMSGPTLLAVRLEPQNVVPPSASTGSGTGVFLLDGSGKRYAMRYRLTYASLASPEVRSIVLRNFGAGKEGAIVLPICGDTQPCPAGKDGTVSGRWTSEDRGFPLTAALVPELANRRIYAEITTAAGKEIRGQLAGNPYMTMPREGVVELASADPAQRASGTGAIRIVRFTPRQTQVQVLVTVAGANADPTSVAISDGSNRFAALRFARAPDSRGRTLRATIDTAPRGPFTVSMLPVLLTAKTLTLTVFLGPDQRTALRGNVEFVR